MIDKSRLKDKNYLSSLKDENLSDHQKQFETGDQG